MFVITFQTVFACDRLSSFSRSETAEKAFFSRRRASRRLSACFFPPRSFVIAVGAEAMAAVDNPLFAEDDFSAFAPEDGVQAPEPSGWHGEPTGPLQPPSPLLDAAQREKLRASRRDRRDPGGRERRDGQRRRALEAKNEALEQEVSSLRRASETRADEALATRAKALRHLEAAEDHVGLLVKESAAKLETLAAEKENDATRRRASTTGDDVDELWEARTSKHTRHHSKCVRRPKEDDDETGALSKARAELAAVLATRAEMDAEAEAREKELRDAAARVEALEAMLRRAGVLQKH